MISCIYSILDSIRSSVTLEVLKGYIDARDDYDYIQRDNGPKNWPDEWHPRAIGPWVMFLPWDSLDTNKYIIP